MTIGSKRRMFRTAAALSIVLLVLLGIARTLVSVPNLTGLDFSSAVGALEDSRLHWATEDGSEPHDLEVVVSQRPAAGSWSLADGDVTLRTKPPVSTVTVPNAIGTQEVDAQTLFVEAGLRLPAGGWIPDGRVIISQCPTPGTRAPFGTQVDYVASIPD